MSLPTYSTAASLRLVEALRHPHGIDVREAAASLQANADPRSRLFDARLPDLDDFPFTALAYAAFQPLQPGLAGTERHVLLIDLIRRGADPAEAATLLLTAFTDTQPLNPRLARKLVIGMHTLTTALVAVHGPVPDPQPQPVAAPAKDDSGIPF